jgi:phosphoglycolate phosphatase
VPARVWRAWNVINVFLWKAVTVKYKLVIFDFDGTLADSFPWLLSIVDQLAAKHNLPQANKNEIEAMRGYDAKTLMKMYRVPLWKVLLMARDTRAMMAAEVHKIRLFDGMERLLRQLAAQGIQLAVVTSNSYENVRQVLGVELTALFDYYECGVSIFGKQDKFRKIQKKSGLAEHEIFAIGDETRDIEAARSAHIACGAVAWGYARVDILQAYAPQEVFFSVEEIAGKVL